MFVLGISYNVGTALAVVLAIGISVDYTIHLTHRSWRKNENPASRRCAATGDGPTGGALLMGPGAVRP